MSILEEIVTKIEFETTRDVFANEVNAFGNDLIQRSYLPLDLKELISTRLNIINRFRPSEIMVATALDYEVALLVSKPDLATAIELLHLYSLIHDDVIDRHERRWHLPTINTEKGVELAVLVGDWCISASFSLIAKIAHELEIPQLMDVFAKGSLAICLGQIDDFTLGQSSEPITLQQYENMCSMKTYIGTLACQATLIVANATEKDINLLTNYCRILGITSQIANDISEIEGIRGFRQPVEIQNRGSNERSIGRKTILDVSSFQAHKSMSNTDIIAQAIKYHSELKNSGQQILAQSSRPTKALTAYLTKANPIWLRQG